MASGFSGVLQLLDLNDFITPSQECIKPIKIQKGEGKQGSPVITDEGDYLLKNEDGSLDKLKKAQITLNDCLACSGCVTSAESVLISQQSQEEFMRVLKENKAYIEANENDKAKIIFVSISPQSRASFAAKYNLSLIETMKKLTGFFHSLGVNYVLDITLAREFALIENQKEFIRRYKSKDSQIDSLPMLASACPGWICYAEKTHGDYILPYISTVKSPQQIMGSLVKDYLCKKLHLKPNQIYHATLMPCFDKKLEASRDEFYNEFFQTRDIDCVITTIEVQAILEEKSILLNEVQSKDLDNLFGQSSELYTHEGSTSGGYCHHILINAAKELFNDASLNFSYKINRNQDFREFSLEKNGQIVLKFAIANGFRNIQNIIHKLKRGKSPYDFVEIMACPSGCANGGAQIRAVDASSKELLSKVEELYHSIPKKKPGENNIINKLYEEWLEDNDSSKVSHMLYTSYRAVEKTNNALLIDW